MPTCDWNSQEYADASAKQQKWVRELIEKLNL